MNKKWNMNTEIYLDDDDDDDDYKIRVIKAKSDQIRPETTTCSKDKNDIELKSSRRKGITFSKCKINPVGSGCQICFIMDGLFNCAICSRFICIRDKFKYNEVTFCKLCRFDPECAPFIYALYNAENKINFMKKIKTSILHALSFECLHKNKK